MQRSTAKCLLVSTVPNYPDFFRAAAAGWHAERFAVSDQARRPGGNQHYSACGPTQSSESHEEATAGLGAVHAGLQVVQFRHHIVKAARLNGGY